MTCDLHDAIRRPYSRFVAWGDPNIRKWLREYTANKAIGEYLGAGS